MVAESSPIPYQTISQTLPNCNIKGSLRIFSSYESYQNYFNNITLSNERNGGMSESYIEVNDSILNDYTQQYFNNPAMAERWFGDKYPKNLTELFDRDEYQSMDEYRDIYERVIKPRLNDIIKESSALLDIPVLKYNDLGLGIFDFAKASLGLIPVYEYYSLKHNKYVDGVDTKVITEKGKYKTILKSDGSDVILVPTLREGYDKKTIDKAFREIYEGAELFSTLKKYDLKIGKFTSTIKKTFLYKENIPKPLNAVRIFIYVGGNQNRTGEQFKYTGYTGIGIAELLTALGYSVSVHAMFATQNSKINDNGRFVDGVRGSAVTLKGFGQTMHSQRLLYITSDPSFFRGKEFINIIKRSQVYSDYIDDNLGYASSTDIIKCLAYQEFGKVDRMWNKKGGHNTNSGMLYYVVGNVTNEQEMNQAILDIALSVVNENRSARDQMGFVTT